MTNWSQDYTVKSNARRAARKASVATSKVVTIVRAGKSLYRFPLPDPEQEAKEARAAARMKKVQAATAERIKEAMAAKKAKKAAKKQASPNRPKTARQSAPKADRGLKFIAVAALLRRENGASITEIVAATGWKPHSARARISVDVSKLLERGEKIVRRREDGLSHYAIVKSGQMELPNVGQEAA